MHPELILDIFCSGGPSDKRVDKQYLRSVVLFQIYPGWDAPRMLGTWFVEVLTNALSGNRYEQRTFPSVLEHDFQVKKTTEATPTWSESGEFHPRWFNVFTPVTIRCTLRFAPPRDDPSSPLYVQALQHWHCIHRFPQAAIWKFARQATPQRWASEHCQEIRNCSPTGEKSTQQIIYKTWLNEMIPNRLGGFGRLYNR